jgi:hypothetical protein
MSFNNPFEQEIKDYFTQNDINFIDESSSFDKLDFTIIDKKGQPAFHLDVKEKRQKYKLSNWPDFAPESDLFILDDLAVRKSLGNAPKSGILIRDNLLVRYFFFSVVDLALMPRKRVNRPINRNQPDLKGKWLINLFNGKEAQSLDKAVSHIRDYLNNLNSVLFETLKCVGNYVNEDIGTGGQIRNPSHWETDILSTR